MVAATVATVGSVIVSQGAVVCSAAAEGAFIGWLTSTFGAGNATSVAGAIGTAASTGAITGALAGSGTAAESAIIGATVASTAATGVSATSIGLSGAVSGGVLGGPALWLVLGTEFNDGTAVQCLSYDCWKPLLRDTSTNPSNGMLLRDVLMDSRIKNVDVSYGTSEIYPLISLENVWGEKFRIEYVRLPWNEMAAHAVPL
ncbi:uncharacterized protein LOC119081711 [Bradysia coprophila]|uniref:uncharacterized protein LOC119081711 n=1 Tax=Bradysia coprophila TaxID=38358 RepID=UPI00187D9D45|nr:uncharacterized protein LOC119081711 [Bradysia coprophila]